MLSPVACSSTATGRRLPAGAPSCSRCRTRRSGTQACGGAAPSAVLVVPASALASLSSSSSSTCRLLKAGWAAGASFRGCTCRVQRAVVSQREGGSARQRRGAGQQAAPWRRRRPPTSMPLGAVRPPRHRLEQLVAGGGHGCGWGPGRAVASAGRHLQRGQSVPDGRDRHLQAAAIGPGATGRLGWALPTLRSQLNIPLPELHLALKRPLQPAQQSIAPATTSSSACQRRERVGAARRNDIQPTSQCPLIPTPARYYSASDGAGSGSAAERGESASGGAPRRRRQRPVGEPSAAPRRLGRTPVWRRRARGGARGRDAAGQHRGGAGYGGEPAGEQRGGAPHGWRPLADADLPPLGPPWLPRGRASPRPRPLRHSWCLPRRPNASPLAAAMGRAPSQHAAAAGAPRCSLLCGANQRQRQRRVAAATVTAALQGFPKWGQRQPAAAATAASSPSAVAGAAGSSADASPPAALGQGALPAVGPAAAAASRAAAAGPAAAAAAWPLWVAACAAASGGASAAREGSAGRSAASRF